VKDRFNLQRFVDAQQDVYAQVLKELKSGRKVSHWMWFIFPQVKGLGHSPMSEFYGIGSLDEARAYLEHPVLGPRLLECTRLVSLIEDRTINEIFGYPDDLKFRSCMTLFSEASPDPTAFVTARQKPGGRT